MTNPELATIRAALTGAAATCRFHGTDFERAGTQYGEPRCDSCRQPWRVVQARAALNRAEADRG